MPRHLFILFVAIFTCLLHAGSQVEQLATGFKFTEGPAICPVDGAVYFSDIPNNRIHRWDPETGEVTLFRENTGGANGLLFADDETLIICAGRDRQVREDNITTGEATVLATKFDGKLLNSPNDTWIDPKGGIYFTDPRYGNRDNLEQDGEHVYYLSPDRQSLIQVVDDMVRPNGIVGSPDGETLIITDHGGKQTWKYAIQPDGTLRDKVLFADQPSDGMAMDEAGNVYLTHTAVDVYSPDGELQQSIELPERPTNVTVLGEDPLTLFVTAQKSIYRITLEN
ncbi:SMP-30/gluconolactonase/LRE family protein [Cerasicoccus fimbriatus]|uniref:SMP-30/gluconolactonase/LRE family protein n=1 Tax=Cerasicoccus fimbriatus TaxID=3014554 RepID=UPI0022B3B26D|nr:SMP-30/gluconolactonase/LRE family protein [Cerasicoccus sp. TK19100]